MKKLHFTVLAASFALLFAAPACGGDDDDSDTDAVVLPDGSSDSGTDAPVQTGDTEDFDRGAGTAQPCDADTDCANANSKCVQEFADQSGSPGGKVCLPACSTTDDCAFNTFCATNSTGTWGGFVLFDNIKGHCYDRSWCGPDTGIENGTTGAPDCMIGGYMTTNATEGTTELPETEQRPGWCQPVQDGAWGFCREFKPVGDGGKNPGETCVLDPEADRTQAHCNAQGGCFQLTAGSPVGQCLAYCDPLQVLEEGGDTCGAGTGCVDLSQTIDVGMGMSLVGRWGVCLLDRVACDVTSIAEGNCPAMQQCAPQTEVNPIGQCQALNGMVAADEACPTQFPAAEFCQAGHWCVHGGTAQATGTCKRQCKIGGDECPEGTTCQTYTYASGDDGVWANADDVKTLDFGACLPTP